MLTPAKDPNGDFKFGLLACLVVSFIVSIAMNLNPYSDHRNVEAPVSLYTDRLVGECDSSRPYINIPYTGPHELTEGIPKYASRSMRLHL